MNNKSSKIDNLTEILDSLGQIIMQLQKWTECHKILSIEGGLEGETEKREEMEGRKEEREMQKFRRRGKERREVKKGRRVGSDEVRGKRGRIKKKGRIET